MKFRIFLTAVLMIFAFQNCKNNSAPSSSKDIKGIFVDFTETEKVKKRIRRENKDFLPAYTELIKKAEQALTEGPFSVIDKKGYHPAEISMII